MILLFCVALSVIIAIISYYQWQLDYWKRRGIPGPRGTIFVGNLHSLTDRAKPVGLVLRDWTKIYGKVYGIHEGFRKVLVKSDIEMVRELFIKKFEYFYGRKNTVIVGDVENDSRVHLFESQGVRWKRLRTISSPAFSVGSLKKIRPTVEDSTLALMNLFDEHANQRAFDVLPKHIMETTKDYEKYLAEMQQRVIERPLIMEQQLIIAQKQKFERKFVERMAAIEKALPNQRTKTIKERNNSDVSAGTYSVKSKAEQVVDEEDYANADFESDANSEDKSSSSSSSSSTKSSSEGSTKSKTSLSSRSKSSNSSSKGSRDDAVP